MREVVVLLPVYNGGDYLKLSVESVLNQSYKDFDLLILDDCSTDGSWAYLSSLTDPRIRLFRNEQNKGLFFNLNLLINNSNSPLMKLWSQDDYMYATCLEKTIAFHKKYPQIGFSYSERHYIDEEGNRIEKNIHDDTPELVSTALHTRIAFYTGSIAGNIANVTLVRSAVNEYGLFREDMRISGDFDMWVRLALHRPVGFIKEPLIQLRDHKQQLSRQEQYYVFHLKEDIVVYKYLLNNINKEERVRGWQLLRNYKLLFYYTLMIKALIKGKLKTFTAFLKILSGFDSILVLSWCFFKKRVLKINPHSFKNNTDFIRESL